MTNLANIRTQLAAVISAAVPAITVYPFYVENPTPPCAIIETAPGVVETFASFDGAIDFQMRVVLLVGASYQQDAQAQLDTWLDSSAATSVVGAIQANGRLNGAANYCVISRIGSAPAGGALHGYQLVEWGGVQYLGTNVMLDVGA